AIVMPLFSPLALSPLLSPVPCSDPEPDPDSDDSPSSGLFAPLPLCAPPPHAASASEITSTPFAQDRFEGSPREAMVVRSAFRRDRLRRTPTPAGGAAPKPGRPLS